MSNINFSKIYSIDKNKVPVFLVGKGTVKISRFFLPEN